MGNIIALVGVVLLGIGGIVLFSAIYSLPVMWLWNSIMVALFKLPALSWSQAWGLNLLCGFLFKSSSSCTCKKD